jgi:hypothetical protein
VEIFSKTSKVLKIFEVFFVDLYSFVEECDATEVEANTTVGYIK